MRRYMMRIAEHLAQKGNCIGLITGESIGQVASQTMQSLQATNAVCTLPVDRPLIGFDKQEIVEIAQRIIDFTSGSTFAISGNLQKISNYIFIITPQSVEISGDFPDVFGGGNSEFSTI